MAFGQPSGPPASFRQLEELTALLHDAGHADFRDARGPMGFTQRQSGGKFTRDEAAAFIERLQDAGADGAGADGPVPDAAEPGPVTARSGPRPPRVNRALQTVPSEQLAAELERRGWRVEQPDGP